MYYNCIDYEDIESTLCKNRILREWYVMHLLPTNEDLDFFFSAFINNSDLKENHKFDTTNNYFHEAELLYTELKEKLSLSKIKLLKKDQKCIIPLSEVTIELLIIIPPVSTYNGNTNTLTLSIPKPQLLSIPSIHTFYANVINEIDSFHFKSIFLHEIVHLLDTNKIILKNRKLPDPKNPKKYKDYYNSSIEFNAYTKQLIYTLQHLLLDPNNFNKELKNILIEFQHNPILLRLKVVEGFMHHLNDYPELQRFVTFVKNLKIVNKRKLHKEIFNYFKQYLY